VTGVTCKKQLQYHNRWEFSHFGFIFWRLAHRALAAFKALSLRSSGVMFAELIFPPILPPFRPMADITLDTAAGILRLDFCALGSVVVRSTIKYAAWFMSDGRLLMRFGIPQVCHDPSQSQNESSPLPKKQET
jgi:hypothetical protein